MSYYIIEHNDLRCPEYLLVQVRDFITTFSSRTARTCLFCINVHPHYLRTILSLNILRSVNYCSCSS